MKNTLYRIEPTMTMEHPELSGSALIMCDGGALFAELHPVKIKAAVKANEPCEYCTNQQELISVMDTTENGPRVRTRVPRHCFNCGRQLTTEEG